MNNKQIDKVALLQEMCDEMKLSIDNLEEVKNQQVLLTKVISRSSEKETFKKFIKETDSQVVKMKDHLKILNDRHDKLAKFLEIVKENPELKSTVNLLLDAIGMFD